MHSLLKLIRIFFLPLKVVCRIIYGDSSSKIVGYAWYEEEGYKKIIASSKDDVDILITDFEIWKEKSRNTIERLENKGWLVIRVKIESKELEKWLKKHGLINTSENREIFVKQRLCSFLESPFI